MSLRKDVVSWGLIVLVATLIIAAAFLVLRPYMQPRVSLHLGDGVFTAQLARTSSERQKGLSGVTNLGETDAMLFVFDANGKPSVQMKNMQVPIDVVWLDANRKVVYIVTNVSPDSYPEEFSPKVEARYIVEVAAGTVDKKAITVGGTASFDLNQVQGVAW